MKIKPYFVWGFSPRTFDFAQIVGTGRAAWFKKIESAADNLMMRLDTKVRWGDFASGMKPWLVCEDRYWEGNEIQVEIFRESFEGKPNKHELILSFMLPNNKAAVTYECSYPKNWKKNPEFKLRSANGKAGMVLDLIKMVEQDWANLKPVDMSKQ